MRIPEKWMRHMLDVVASKAPEGEDIEVKFASEGGNLLVVSRKCTGVGDDGSPVYAWELQPDPEDEFGPAKQRIMRAAKEQSPREAIRTLGKCWSDLDAISTMAEAQTRIVLRKMEDPELAPIPPGLAGAWLHSSLYAVDNTAKLAVRAALHALGDLGERKLSVQICRMAGGKAEVEWWDVRESELVSSWIFYPSELRWPGLRAKVYSPSEPGSFRLISKRFYNAFDLIDDLCAAAAQPE
tara:strand:+ start:17293 stop:18012 length:720 start_codon:yes stop_codon:yes gene_type:complete